MTQLEPWSLHLLTQNVHHINRYQTICYESNTKICIILKFRLILACKYTHRPNESMLLKFWLIQLIIEMTNQIYFITFMETSCNSSIIRSNDGLMQPETVVVVYIVELHGKISQYILAYCLKIKNYDLTPSLYYNIKTQHFFWMYA